MLSRKTLNFLVILVLVNMFQKLHMVINIGLPMKKSDLFA